MADTIEAMKERMSTLGQQIRAIKQGGAGSSNGEGSLEGVQAELKELKAKLAKAEKEAKLEAEMSKVTLKVPKVCLRALCHGCFVILKFGRDDYRARRTTIRRKCYFATIFSGPYRMSSSSMELSLSILPCSNSRRSWRASTVKTASSSTISKTKVERSAPCDTTSRFAADCSRLRAD